MKLKLGIITAYAWLLDTCKTRDVSKNWNCQIMAKLIRCVKLYDIHGIKNDKLTVCWLLECIS